jgi:flagellar basal-body rod protein FlgB
MDGGMFTGTNYQLAGKMLDYTTLRQKALASNLANLNVPGYKRVDVSSDFQTELSKAVSSGNMQNLQALTPKLAIDPTASTTRSDGNNVEMDREMMEMNKTSTDYEYLVRYMNYNYQMTRSAITSQGS